MPYEKYETIIGLEVHIQLATASKAFCGDENKFTSKPNTHISPISLAHPGTMPRLNERQVEYAVRLGLALGCRINPNSHFDRKNYFYADLPKGYQITQQDNPICIGGQIAIQTKQETRNIRIHHIHMEEDAGKSVHDKHSHQTMIDLNRAGVPLLELVTEPDFRSAEEVNVFMNKMRQLVRYIEISDGNMEEGSMRCDCNISVRLKGSELFGNRCEVKNVNSMRFARRAITYEVKRQIDLIESGGTVLQQTLNFDPVTGKTSPLRSKEDAHDYRYFPEPDLPPVVLSELYIDNIRQKLAPLPWVLRTQFMEEYQLSEYDAQLLTEQKEDALFFIACCQKSTHYKLLANLFINKLKTLKKDNPEVNLSPARLAEFVELIATNQVGNTTAYQQLFPAMIDHPETPLATLTKEMNLTQNSDDDFLDGLIEEVLTAFPDKVKAYQNGKKNLIQLFIGQIMKRSKGKADAKKVKEKLEEILSK